MKRTLVERVAWVLRLANCSGPWEDWSPEALRDVRQLHDAAVETEAKLEAMVEALKNARGMALRHHREDECEECGVLVGEIDAALAVKEG